MIITTGGSGFVGKTLLLELIKNDYKVINLINKNPSGVKGVKEIKLENISEKYLSKIINGCNTVIHLAAALGSTKANYNYYYKVNTLFPKNMVKASIENNVNKFIYISSAGVYGKGIKKNKKFLDENIKPTPIDKYEETKYLGEREVLKYKDRIHTTIIRPGWIYGEGDRRTLKLFKAVNSGIFFIAGNGNNYQTPVYVKDIVTGIFKTLENKEIDSGEIFNIAGDKPIQTKKMIKLISRTLNKKILPFKIPLIPLKLTANILEFMFSPFNFNPPLTISSLAFFERNKPLSIEKAKKYLDYYPSTDFEFGIKKTITWYKKNNLL